MRGRLARRQQCDASRARGHRALGRLTRAECPPGCAGVSPADSSVTHHGSEGVLGARARCPGSPHEGGTPAWVRGRLARRQQCDPSRARGHRALGRLTRAGRPPGSAGVSPADSSVTHHGSAGILGARASRPQTAVCRLLGARASRPGSPHEGRTPAWGCGRLARRQQCAASWARGPRALGRLTRVGRPPGSAGVSPADSSVTHHGSAGILGARASRPQTAV